MKSKYYFVSYHYKRETGCGNGYIVYRQRKYKPLSYKDIEEDLRNIKNDNGYEGVVLISFGRYER